jgi:prepilin-type N-terminal cleavage/methylation domain-containing protein
MKIHSKTTHAHGFTLIELLVVMVIIAVLAGAGFTGGSAAMNKARKVSSQAHAVSISSAVDSFYNDYSALPDPGATPGGLYSGPNDNFEPNFMTDAGDGFILLEILNATGSTSSAGSSATVTRENPRLIKFFSPKEAKNPTANPKDGIVYNLAGTAVNGFYDAWGEPFFIKLDTNYNERLAIDFPGSIPDPTLNGRRVAVYSLGVANPADAKPNTLVTSW